MRLVKGKSKKQFFLTTYSLEKTFIRIVNHARDIYNVLVDTMPSLTNVFRLFVVQYVDDEFEHVCLKLYLSTESVRGQKGENLSV